MSRLTKKAKQKEELKTINGMTKEELLELVGQACESGVLSFKDTFQVNHVMSSKHIQQMKEEGVEFKSRISLDEQTQAYKHILESGVSAQEAFKHIQKLNDLTDEYINTVKHNKFHKDDGKRVVLAHDKHPVQKDMINKGIIDRVSLKASNTPNQQLSNLSRVKQIHQTIESLQRENKTHAMDIDSIKRILEDNGIKIDKIEMCKYLKNKGYTIDDLANHYLVSKSTIKRWLKL